MKSLVLLLATVTILTCCASSSPTMHPTLEVRLVVQCGTPHAVELSQKTSKFGQVCGDQHVLATERDVRKADVRKGLNNTFFVALATSEHVGAVLHDVTSKHIREQVAIVLDGTLHNVATIVGATPDIFVGGMSEAEAKQLAERFNSLPKS
jgi:preprotein translocase subunit SecD